ncbi:PIN-like domain-containing protein [Cellulosimicrobium funkei]|uniref:PIN-like domain-containing protein n=1 Tax=Cellulosimicrobium funkei TaxID=264251 RepID=UPI00375654BC
MRSQFSHHYERPDDEEVNTALREATVVLDTNVLLGLYRASPTLRTTRLKVLKTIGPRLFVPHQVGIEFHRRRREVAAEIRHAYAALRAATKEYGDAIKAFGGDGRYDETATRVKELVDPLLEKINEGLDELEKNDPHRIDLRNDTVLAELEGLLADHQIGQAPRAKKLAAQVRDFATIRVPLGLPPGFDDAHKQTNAAGDYLLWCEVLDYARKHETDVVLITDDAKSDWWQTGGDRLPNVPHPLLVSEFRRETGQAYYQLNSRELLKKASALDVTVSTANLEEEEELAAAQEARRFLSVLSTVALSSPFVQPELQRFLARWGLSPSDHEELLRARRNTPSGQVDSDGFLPAEFRAKLEAGQPLSGWEAYELERMRAARDWNIARERLDQAARDIEQATDEQDPEQP